MYTNLILKHPNKLLVRKTFEFVTYLQKEKQIYHKFLLYLREGDDTWWNIIAGNCEEHRDDNPILWTSLDFFINGVFTLLEFQFGKVHRVLTHISNDHLNKDGLFYPIGFGGEKCIP